MDITEKERDVLVEVLNSAIEVNTKLKLYGHQIDTAKEEEIVLRGVVYKLGKIEFDK